MYKNGSKNQEYKFGLTSSIIFRGPRQYGYKRNKEINREQREEKETEREAEKRKEKKKKRIKQIIAKLSLFENSVIINTGKPKQSNKKLLIFIKEYYDC